MIPKVGKAISVGQRDPAARWIFQIIRVLGKDSTSWLLITVIDEGKDVLVRDGKCFDRGMQMQMMKVGKCSMSKSDEVAIAGLRVLARTVSYEGPSVFNFQAPMPPTNMPPSPSYFGASKNVVPILQLLP